MSNRQNDIFIDNLIDRMENLGIYDLLVGNPKGYKIDDMELLEKYINYFEELNPLENEDGETSEYYFWCIKKLKNEIENDKAKKIIQTIIKPIMDKNYKICENCEQKSDTKDGYILSGNDEEYYICQKCLKNNYKFIK